MRAERVRRGCGAGGGDQADLPELQPDQDTREPAVEHGVYTPPPACLPACLPVWACCSSRGCGCGRGSGPLAVLIACWVAAVSGGDSAHPEACRGREPAAAGRLPAAGADAGGRDAGRHRAAYARVLPVRARRAAEEGERHAAVLQHDALPEAQSWHSAVPDAVQRARCRQSCSPLPAVNGTLRAMKAWSVSLTVLPNRRRS
eukprot:COSAG02_NODE_722_length_18047_cov_5.952803_5_plen_202_part_00